MDRKDANLIMACKSIEKHLQISPLILQLPEIKNGKLVGKLQYSIKANAIQKTFRIGQLNFFN